MQSRIRALITICVSTLLAACASTYTLSDSAKSERAGMNDQRAEAILHRFAQPTSQRGGLCMIGIHMPTHLDPGVPARISGTKVTVTGSFAHVSNVQVLGVTGQVGVGFAGAHGQATVDTRHLKELRVIDLTTQDKVKIFAPHCPDVKPGYLVIFKSEKGLPDGANLDFNVSNKHELDNVLAALSYLSPKARLVEGLGM